MDEFTTAKQKILLSILNGHENVTAVRNDAHLSPKRMKDLLRSLSKEGLIRQTKNWKRGKTNNLSLTPAGAKSIIDVSIGQAMSSLTNIVSLMKTTRNREILRNVVKNAVIKGETVEERVRIHTSIFEPFRKLRLKSLEVESFLSSTFSSRAPSNPELSDNNDNTAKLSRFKGDHYLFFVPGISLGYDIGDSADLIEKSYWLFSPGLTYGYSWLPGVDPDFRGGVFPKMEDLALDPERMLQIFYSKFISKAK